MDASLYIFSRYKKPGASRAHGREDKDMSRRIEAPCGGIPIRYAQIEWTPMLYADMPDYAETAGHAVVIDKREIRRLAEAGLQHPLVHKYPCSEGACNSEWKELPTKYHILEVMRICFNLLMLDSGILKEDVLNILYSISETKYIFTDEVYKHFGFKCPSDEDSDAFGRYLNRLYGVRW